MSVIGNLLWIVFGGGILLFLEYLIGGFVLCVTVIGIPFGVQAVKLSMLALLPFGKEIVLIKPIPSPVAVIMNILWLLFGGIYVAATHLIFGVLCAITIIGIPFAKQHLKLAKLSLTPFGYTYR
jgi:uncharacterized membrane protein YccF (DUF307 family)